MTKSAVGIVLFFRVRKACNHGFCALRMCAPLPKTSTHTRTHISWLITIHTHTHTHTPMCGTCSACHAISNGLERHLIVAFVVGFGTALDLHAMPSHAIYGNPIHTTYQYMYIYVHTYIHTYIYIVCSHSCSCCQNKGSYWTIFQLVAQKRGILSLGKRVQQVKGCVCGIIIDEFLISSNSFVIYMKYMYVLCMLQCFTIVGAYAVQDIIEVCVHTYVHTYIERMLKLIGSFHPFDWTFLHIRRYDLYTYVYYLIIKRRGRHYV